MSTKRTIGQEASVEQRSEYEFAAVEERPELRPTVEMEIQAKVDTNHPDVGMTGLTLAAEERMRAREWEIAKTRKRWDDRQESDREARTRRRVSEQSKERNVEFERRAASVDARLEPGREDPREGLSREELAAVNQQATRIHRMVKSSVSRAVLSKQIAERVVGGAELVSAAVAVIEVQWMRPGGIVPIAKVEDVDRGEVTVEGQVKQLWEPSHPAIQSVGLLEDESGRIRFTVWKKSKQPLVREGERVRFRAAAKNWYEGRCSIALTRWSNIEFPERGEWWK
ncbi:DNA-binding protein [Haladaptatus sp. GCM10025707]|uniref:DNA-binding protein n=1 Tax=unclassified Haladaptatus TaxID=2622732 RepID=UPI0023E7C92D|nr:DNA-binding protein [Haladaptatus sp. QDMS2]